MYDDIDGAYYLYTVVGTAADNTVDPEDPTVFSSCCIPDWEYYLDVPIEIQTIFDPTDDTYY